MQKIMIPAARKSIQVMDYQLANEMNELENGP